MLNLILYVMLIFTLSFQAEANSCVYDEKTLSDNLSKYIDSIEVTISEGKNHYAVYIYFQDKIDGYALNGASFEIEDAEISDEIIVSIPLEIRDDKSRKLLSFLVDKEKYRYSKVSIFYKRCGLVFDIRLKDLDREPLSKIVEIK